MSDAARIRRSLLPLLAALLAASTSQARDDARKPSASIESGATATRATAVSVQSPTPVITAVMPFSSCSPGGSVILKGENFGSQPGKLRLVGHFPGPYVNLTQLEWKDGSIGGQVPDVSGALDQEVGVQVVRKDGKPSAPRKCQFTAKRVRKRVAQDVIRIALCFPGENAGTGCLVDDEPDRAQQTPSGCWHKNNSCGLPTDKSLYGRDEITVASLKNGWRYKKLSFHQPQFGDTEDEGVHSFRANMSGNERSWSGIQGGSTEFDVDAVAMVLSVPWKVPRGELIHYVFGFEIEGPEGIPFDEVVTLPSKEQTLDDWNPIAPRGPADLQIVLPAEGGTVGSSQFDLTLDASSPDRNWQIELEWTSDRPGKDPSIEKYSTPQNAPKLVNWRSFPKAIRVADLGGPGKYSVRAKVKGRPGNTWTDYRHFSVVESKLQKGAMGSAALSKQGEIQRKPELQRADPRAPQARGMAVQKAAATQLAPTGAKLSFVARGVKVEQPAAKGRPFGVTGVSVRNGGTADSPKTFLTVSCRTLAGGSVRALQPRTLLPPIGKGKSHPLGLASACAATDDGRYRLTLTLGAEETWSHDIQIPAADAAQLRRVQTAPVREAVPDAPTASPRASPQAAPAGSEGTRKLRKAPVSIR